MIKKILVTGGFGYVGSRLTPHLLSQGYHVRVLDLCLYGEQGLKALTNDPEFSSDYKNRFEFIRGDIREPEVIEAATKGMDSIIHLAAISNDPTGEINEVLTRQVNFDAVGLLLSIAKKNGVKRFINASSSSVFGARGEQNINESLEPEPITFYSKYKMLSEWLVVAASEKEFCTVNVRPATICGYSPRQRFDLTVNKLTADAFHKGLITVHGGEQRRPNVGMRDMINIYSQLLTVSAEKINGRTFNFGFENYKVIEIAQKIQKYLEPIKVEIKVTEVLDARDYHISSHKILKELNYEPVSSIQREVEDLRAALATEFKNSDEPRFYNMKSMNLPKNDHSYSFLSV